MASRLLLFTVLRLTRTNRSELTGWRHDGGIARRPNSADSGSSDFGQIVGRRVRTNAHNAVERRDHQLAISRRTRSGGANDGFDCHIRLSCRDDDFEQKGRQQIRGIRPAPETGHQDRASTMTATRCDRDVQNVGGQEFAAHVVERRRLYEGSDQLHTSSPCRAHPTNRSARLVPPGMPPQRGPVWIW